MALPPPSSGSTALVTGASSGIGAELARQLARRGHGVTLVARRGERLERLAVELAEQHGIRTEAVQADLVEPAERDLMASEIEARGLTVEVLVNNAGFGIYRPFAESRREQELRQVRLLVEAVVDLDARYAPAMVERGRGAIVNLASTAGFQPLPGSGTYAAAKSFVLSHTEALHEELRGKGVTATAVCPGPVQTEFQEVADSVFDRRVPRALWATAEQVAEEALRAVDAGKRVVVPGGLAIRAAFGAGRLSPSELSLPISRLLMSGEMRRGRGS